MSVFDMLKAFFVGIGRGLAFLRVTIANLLILAIMALGIVLLFAGPDPVDVPDGGALVAAPGGSIVEQAGAQDPLTLLTGGVQGQTVLPDLLDGIAKARDDDRISTLVLDVTSLGYVAPAQLEVIGAALETFRTDDGKTIVAKSRFYGRDQYYLASFADEIYVHPMGDVMPTGYGMFRNYYYGLFDLLDVNVHVFRVGTYKEFVEPYTRTDMSPAAREANQALVDSLWSRYVDRVAENRGIEPEAFIDYVARYDELLAGVSGNAAELALQHGLVDGILVNQEVTERLREVVGEDGESYRRVGFGDYVQPRIPPLFGDVIGVIAATGSIVMGEAPRGTIGAKSMAGLLRQAREDDAVKAVVLRIDSGGGSALASEIIRREVLRVQDAGKPVVASMAGTAASGGYWIAATADEIWAAPTTITGSIGIFGLVPTFEETLGRVGVTYDGVRTGPLVGDSTTGGISDATARVLQATVDYGYRQFIDLVASGRDMTTEEVEAVAEGRVWTGERAHELGLVDHLGHLGDAVDSAAALADVERFKVRYIEEPLSPQEMLLQQAMENFGLVRNADQSPGITERLTERLRAIGAFNDPRHVYAVCEACQLND
ncbi:MAG: signal peptide peptidase SppA [Gammaproteobacteria bacterium]|nr:signal peptide peptidase SppA [Gammaproteobacteria bacterium]